MLIPQRCVLAWFWLYRRSNKPSLEQMLPSACRNHDEVVSTTGGACLFLLVY